MNYLILLFTILPLIIIFSIHHLNALASVCGIMLTIVIAILMGLRFAKKNITVIVDDSEIKFENISIQLTDIVGYYINRQSPIITQIEFKDNYKDYSLSSPNYGQNGKDFETFLNDFLKGVQIANKNSMELSYYDFHPKQYKFSRVYIYVLMVVILIINLTYLFLVMFKNVSFNWKLLFLNFIFLGLYDFHRKNSKKYKRE
jgi:hypothetical protein